MTIQILIVDDDRDLLVLIERFLTREHPEFKTFLSVSAQDALRRIESEGFDAIVCDFHLGEGEMNGLELLEWLRGAGSDIPFIMFTGRSREEVAIRALNLGASFYLKKDVEDFENLFEELAHHIKNAVEKKEIEEALQESESRFRAIFEWASVGIARVTIDGYILEANFALAQMLGFELEELSGMNILEFSTGDEKELESRLTREMVQGIRDSYQLEKQLMKKDNERIWGRVSVSAVLNSKGEPVFTIYMVEDITESKRDRYALMESEERFRTIFENSGLGILVYRPDGLILDANPALCSMLGYSRTEILAMMPKDLVHREDFKASYEKYMSVIAAGGSVFNAPHRFFSKNGEIIWTNVNISIQYSPDGDPEILYGMIQDISEQRQVQEELSKSEEKYRALVDQASMGIILLEGNPLRISYANPLVCRVLEKPLEECTKLATRQLLDYIHPKDSKRVRAFLDRFLTGSDAESNIEFVIIDPKQRELWVQCTISRIQIGGSTLYQVILINTTERKKYEMDLHESKEKFARMFMESPIAIELVDEKGKIIDINPAGLKMFGVSQKEELIGFDLHKDPNTPDNVKEALTEGKPSRFTNIFDFDIIHKEGLYQTSKTGKMFVDARVTPLKDPTTGLTFGNLIHLQDITFEKQQEQKLLEQAALLENASDAVISTDENFIIKTWNRAAENMYGWKSKEVIGKVAGDVLRPLRYPTGTTDSDVKSEIKKNGGWRGEAIQKTKDGRTIHIAGSVSQIKDDNGKPIGYVIVNKDMSDIKRHEHRLRLTQFSVDTSPIPIYWVRPNASFMYVNKAAADMLGYSIDDLMKMTVHDIDILYDHKRWAKLKKELDNAKSLTFESRLKKHDGSIIDVEITTTLLEYEGQKHINASVVDITERKEVLRKLQESKERYKMILNSMSDLVFVFDENNRYVELINADKVDLPRFPDEFIGKTPSDVLGPEVGKRFNVAFERVRVTGKPQFVEYSVVIRGREHWFSSKISLHENGKGFVSVSRDITEQVMATRELMHQREELSQFAHTMGHDINNFVLKLRMMTKLIESSENKEQIDKMNNILVEMSEMVKHSVMLADAGLTVDKQQDIDLHLLIDNMASTLIPEGTSFENTCKLRITGDRSKLSQALTNIVENALQHGKPQKIFFRCEKQDSSYILSIANDGREIPDDIRDDIFTRRISTIDPRRGFGLQIVRKIIESHGWSIQLGKDKQTTFEIIIPDEDVLAN